MARQFDRKLILEDGSEYYGYSFGANCERVVEVVFDTSMAGYQEIVSDHAYANQGVVMTYPIIGSYGIGEEENEERAPSIGALIVAEYNDEPSNFLCKETLAQKLERCSIPGMYGADTRKLTRSIRDFGCRKGLITSAETSLEEGLRKIANAETVKNVVATVSAKTKREYCVKNARFKIAAIDCGINADVIRLLNASGANVAVFPYDVTAEEIEKYAADGLFISDGPGDPQDAACVVKTVKALKGKLPMLGVGLGHQIIALAYGAKTYKLKFGHRGCNHSVKRLSNGKVEIVAQNHGYAVDAQSAEEVGLTVTQVNLLDGSVESICNENDKAIGVQYRLDGSAKVRASGNPLGAFLKNVQQRKAEK